MRVYYLKKKLEYIKRSFEVQNFAIHVIDKKKFQLRLLYPQRYFGASFWNNAWATSSMLYFFCCSHSIFFWLVNTLHGLRTLNTGSGLKIWSYVILGEEKYILYYWLIWITWFIKAELTRRDPNHPDHRINIRIIYGENKGESDQIILILIVTT